MIVRGAVVAAVCVSSLACTGRWAARNQPPTPAAVGLNTRDLIDLPAQGEADQIAGMGRFVKAAEAYRQQAKPAVLPPKRTVLCLSGGGAYGAYSAGVLYGWTCRGDRPRFDVVTGISTGALIAPFAFLGSKYDEPLREFYTTLESNDIYRKRPVRGFFTDSFADDSALVRILDRAITPDILCAIAVEHGKGRRLYIGTTEQESGRFVSWDMGAIASRGAPDDLALFKLVLKGSCAIPGFFPPARIPVDVDGKRLIERHVDGGTSQSLFFRPPHIPPERMNDPDSHSLYDSDVYVLVAGKLYADPDATKPRAIKIAETSVSTVIYAQTRGDLTRLWTVCQLTGMNYHSASIPDEFPAPKLSTEFRREELLAMFNEGVRQVRQGTVWRKTPPGVEPGEAPLVREGTNLTHIPQTASPTPSFTSDPFGWPYSQQGIPIPPGLIAK